MKNSLPFLAIGLSIGCWALAARSAGSRSRRETRPTTTASAPLAAKKPTIQPQQLVGDWYMGTMSGFDCNLKINSDNTLSVQFGGCFSQDPPINTRWKLEGDRIQFQSTALNNSLGPSLRVVRYKNHWVLRPQRSKVRRDRIPTLIRGASGET